MNCATTITYNIVIKKLILVAEPDSLVVRIEVLISDVSITSTTTTMATTANIILFL